MKPSGLSSGAEPDAGRAGLQGGLWPILLALCLVTGVMAAILTSRTPAPQPADAPPQVFSAARAMVDDRVIARVPHPEGSPAALDARNYIFQRMTALGLSPRRVTAEAAEAPPRFRGRYASGGVVENLIGVLPGTAPAAPAIMLMAHSDSVPGSPGAADDAAGVISALETVRALKAAGPHRRDVIVLITDGEEVGLLGARAFFAPTLEKDRDPLLKHIGMIVNMEARGGGGRVAMFETGANDGAAIAAFAKAVKNTDALSLMSEVYKYLPNSTDFTVSKTAGYPGYNFAFTGEEFDYHSPSSTPAVLDQGSVQHMGDQALAITRALADSASLPGKRRDAIYSDVLGGPVIAYPPLVGWLILGLSGVMAVAGAVIGARRSGEEIGLSSTVRGMAAVLCATLAAALVLHLGNRLLGGDVARYRNLLAQYDLLFAATAALTLGVVLLVWRVAVTAQGRCLLCGLALFGGVIDVALNGLDMFGMGSATLTAILALCFSAPMRTWSGWLGALIVGALLTLALQMLAPPLTVATAWPFFLGALGILLAAVTGGGRFERFTPVIIVLALALISVVQLGHLASLIFTAVGPDTPEAMALIPLLAAFALYPVLKGWGGSRGAVGGAAFFTALGVIGLAVVALRDPASARTPHPVQAFYLDDKTDGKAWRASALPRLDPWSRAALGGQPMQQARTPIFDKVLQVPALAVDLPDPVFQSNATPTPAGQAVTLTIAPKAGGREVRLYLQPTVPLTNVALNGQPTELVPKPGAWVMLRWDGATTPLTLTFTAKAGGALDLRYEEIAEGWPAGLAAPPKPATMMPWGLSDDTVVIDRFQPQW